MALDKRKDRAIIEYLCVEMATGQHITKTNAVRLLEAAGVPFELVSYEVDENNLAAEHVAEQLGKPLEQVFKTLVLRGDRNGLFVCVMPGNMEIDLKVAAKIYVSAGVRGLQFKIAPGDLIDFVGAELYPL